MKREGTRVKETARDRGGQARGKGNRMEKKKASLERNGGRKGESMQERKALL